MLLYLSHEIPQIYWSLSESHIGSFCIQAREASLIRAHGDACLEATASEFHPVVLTMLEHRNMHLETT